MRGGGSSPHREGSQNKSVVPAAPQHSDTRWLDDDQNYNADIKYLSFNDDFFEKLQQSEFISNLELPLLLYSEERVDQNKLYTATTYFYRGQLKRQEAKSHRYLLDNSNYYEALIAKQTSIDTSLSLSRGLALHLATQIEYFVEFFCCVKLNAYESTENERLSLMLLKPNSGTLGSIRRRVEFLKKETNYISNSYDFLKMVMFIRNNLAHQFFPEFIVPSEWVREDESESRALIRIMENTWFYLLKDLSKYQNILIDILNTRMKIET